MNISMHNTTQIKVRHERFKKTADSEQFDRIKITATNESGERHVFNFFTERMDFGLEAE